MSATTLLLSVTAAQAIIVFAMVCAAYRIVKGPRAQDRILGLDFLYVNVLLLLMIFGIRTGSTLYFEAALVIALLGFVSSIAFAKFLMRGEVIE